jgi:hypothetical protein
MYGPGRGEVGHSVYGIRAYTKNCGIWPAEWIPRNFAVVIKFIFLEDVMKKIMGVLFVVCLVCGLTSCLSLLLRALDDSSGTSSVDPVDSASEVKPVVPAEIVYREVSLDELKSIEKSLALGRESISGGSGGDAQARPGETRGFIVQAYICVDPNWRQISISGTPAIVAKNFWGNWEFEHENRTKKISNVC